MPYDFGQKKKKTPDDLKRAARAKDSFKSKTAPKAKRGPKRSVTY